MSVLSCTQLSSYAAQMQRESTILSGEPNICIRKTFIEVREDSPPPILRSKTAPSICFDSHSVTWNEEEEDPWNEEEEEKESEQVEKPVSESDDKSQQSKLAGSFRLRADAKPFFPEVVPPLPETAPSLPEAVLPSRTTEMRDLVPLRLTTEMHDLSTLVDRFVSDVHDFNSTLPKVIEEDTMASTDPMTQDFMDRLLESLNGLCECTPKEVAAAVKCSKASKMPSQKVARRTLDVPFNTPANKYCQGKSPYDSGVMDPFAMGRSEDVLCSA